MIRSMYGLQQLSYQALPAQTMTPPRAEAAPLNAPVLASAENAAK
jgi:hypothetical protein